MTEYTTNSTALINALTVDLVELRKADHVDDIPQWRRRSYVRALFAFIEGWIFVTKQVFLDDRYLDELEIGELVMLKEERYQLQNGKPKTKPNFVTVDENLRFVIFMVNKLGKDPLCIQNKDSGWQILGRAKEIRDRLTHPKTWSDFDLSNDEIDLCNKTFTWFLALASAVSLCIVGKDTDDGKAMMEAFLKALTESKRER